MKRYLLPALSPQPSHLSSSFCRHLKTFLDRVMFQPMPYTPPLPAPASCPGCPTPLSTISLPSPTHISLPLPPVHTSRTPSRVSSPSRRANVPRRQPMTSRATPRRPLRPRYLLCTPCSMSGSLRICICVLACLSMDAVPSVKTSGGNREAKLPTVALGARPRSESPACSVPFSRAGLLAYLLTVCRTLPEVSSPPFHRAQSHRHRASHPVRLFWHALSCAA